MYQTPRADSRILRKARIHRRPTQTARGLTKTTSCDPRRKTCFK
ncbi:hypothetical protein CO709_31420 [Burkholderia thailandensis]|nr:hypothetical protein CO709_31420 [Burkholderia thailandensis]